MPAISRIWARSALISAGLQPQQGKTGTRATGQRNWPTHPAVSPGTDDQNSTPARELEPPQPLLRSLDGGQHPCAKIGDRARSSTAPVQRTSVNRADDLGLRHGVRIRHDDIVPESVVARRSVELGP